MYYMYVLKGRMQRKLYIGSTNDLRRRLSEHARKESTYTSKASDWQLIYYEAYGNREDAVERERMLKSYGSAYGHLKKRLARSIGD
jgi:putative endonuclease